MPPSHVPSLGLKGRCLAATLSEFKCFYVIIFFGRIGLKAKAAVTRIPESNRRRIVSYLNGSEEPHALTLSKYGKGQLREGERWVLLERALEGEDAEEH